MSHRINNLLLIPVLFGAFLLSGCESWLPDAHRPDYTQGNPVKREELAKIQVGMKKNEITPIIGSPAIKDPFHANRWDYIYRFLPGKGEIIQSRITLFFEGDELVSIDDSEYVEPRTEKDEKEEPTKDEEIEKPYTVDEN